MKSLFITEKPSVAMEFAKALGVGGEKRDGYLEDDENIITWCVGHLVTMSYPEKYDPDLKKWSMDALPFLPEQYLYEPIESTKKQFNVVSKLLNRKDVGCIYYAGDSAREGEYIQRLVRQLAGHNEKAEEKRVWIDSQTYEEIRRGVKEARPLSDYDLLSDAAYARSIEDYAVGINFSRALTLKYSDAAASGVGKQHVTIAVGRVMSCVLGMAVRREREIRTFKETQYFGVTALIGDIEAAWSPNPPSKLYTELDLYEKKGFVNSVLAEKFMASLPESAVLKEKTFKTAKKGAPLLFSLAELQGECSRRFKMSPSETLEAAQSLYERKLTTYPRTDARVLTTAVSKVILNNINGLSSLPGYAQAVSDIAASGSYRSIAKTKYVDDSKVSDHYAIIPTGNTQGIGTLSERERDVYDLICRRFLSIFMPAAEYEKMNAVFLAGAEEFCVSGEALRSPGWMEVAGAPKANPETEALLNAVRNMKEGAAYPASYEAKPGETRPPARYTGGSMILAMENAGKLIEDEELREQIKGSGIGTSATRAAIIEKLIKNGYLESSSSQVITPTLLGEIIYEILDLCTPQVLSPDITANWEKGLSQIERGEIGKERYISLTHAFVSKTIRNIKEDDCSGEIRKRISALFEVYGVSESVREKNYMGPELSCPSCGAPLKRIKTGKYEGSYVCSRECGFKLWNTYGGKKLSEKSMTALITNGITDAEVTNLTSKAGKKYSARLKLENGRVRPTFD